MTPATLETGRYLNPLKQARQSSLTNPNSSEEIIYAYFLNIVKTWSAELVCFEFERLFIQFLEVGSPSVWNALNEIISSDDKLLFLNTLKRCIYILVNNWQAERNSRNIQQIVEVFDDRTPSSPALSPTLKRLRLWLAEFCQSQDYQDLKLFAAKHEDRCEEHWTQRYTSYLLADRYVDPNSPREQREAARVLSQKLKDRFKLNLAMYASRLGSSVESDAIVKNPTNLGDDALRLIKTIVTKRGSFSYANLANIFLKQTRDVTYLEFKKALLKYLIFSLENQSLGKFLTERLAAKLEALYEAYNGENFNSILLLKTCNKILEYLTTETNGEPSLLFIFLLSQGNYLTLVIILLKIVLACPSSSVHLEARIGKMIRYCEAHPSKKCQWFINFLEIFKITFAIHAENVEYNIIKLHPDAGDEPSSFNEENYRVFCIAKKARQKNVQPLMREINVKN